MISKKFCKKIFSFFSCFLSFLWERLGAIESTPLDAPTWTPRGRVTWRRIMHAATWTPWAPTRGTTTHCVLGAHDTYPRMATIPGPPTSTTQAHEGHPRTSITQAHDSPRSGANIVATTPCGVWPRRLQVDLHAFRQWSHISQAHLSPQRDSTIGRPTLPTTRFHASPQHLSTLLHNASPPASTTQVHTLPQHTSTSAHVLRPALPTT